MSKNLIFMCPQRNYMLKIVYSPFKYSYYYITPKIS